MSESLEKYGIYAVLGGLLEGGLCLRELFVQLVVLLNERVVLVFGRAAACHGRATDNEEKRGQKRF